MLNLVTKIFPINGATLSEEDIQTHFDAMNSDGWNLVGVDNLGGWYRFFWEK